MIKSLLLLSTLLIFSLTFAQSLKKEEFENFQQQFHSDDFICLESTIDISISTDKKRFIQKNSIKQRFLVLTEEGVNQLFKGSIEYDSLSPVRNYKVKIRNLLNSTQTAEISKPYPKISTNYVFFNGESQIDYRIPGLEIGTVIEITYTEIPKDPHLPTLHFLGYSYPILSSKMTVEYPSNSKIEVQEYNILENQLKKTNQSDEDETSIVYEYSSLKSEYQFEKNAPGILTVAPHLIMNVLSYEINDSTINVLDDLNALENWYRLNIQNIVLEEPSPELTKLAHSITDSLPIELDKVKAIYYWVQGNINYIAFEDGKNGYIPRLASNTLLKRYGDCKDMASLIYVLLKSLNISSNLTWVGTRDRNYTYAKSHNPLIDNHMITTYQNNGKTYILDATNPFQPITIPTSFIQGKEMLILKSDDSFDVKVIECTGHEINYRIDTTVIAYENNTIHGSSKSIYSGYEKIDLYHNLSNRNIEEQKSKIAQEIFPSNTRVKITDLKIENLKNRDTSTTIDYNWISQQTGTLVKGNLYLNILIYTNLLSEWSLSQRTSTLQLDHLFLKRSTIKFKVPDGYVVTSTPEKFESNPDLFNLNINYQTNNQFIYVNVEFELKKNVIHPSEFQTLLEIQKTIIKELSKSIILTAK